MAARPRPLRAASPRIALAVCALAAVLALAGCSTEALRAEDPLDASPPAEQVLRTLRIAGLDEASAGRQGGTAVAWLRLPAADSAVDVEAAWVTGIAALRTSFRDARRYEVRLSGPADEPLVVLTFDGDKARSAANAAELRDSADVTYPATAEDALGSADDDSTLGMASLPPFYLDAKNAAAGSANVAPARSALGALAQSAPGRPAPTLDAGVTYASRIASLLGQPAEETAAALLASVLRVQPGATPAQVLALRRRLSAVEAMSAPMPGEDELFSAIDAEARRLASARVLRSGDAAQALLAAAVAERAPAEAAQVTSFERIASLDASGSPEGSELPNRVLAALRAQGSAEPRVSWDGESVAPDRWLAYYRADGTVYWLAGEGGPVALTDASVDGFAWRTSRAALVDSASVGIRRAVLPLP